MSADLDQPAPCECPLAGYCARHAMRKTHRQHELCQTRVAYRRMWDRRVSGEPAPPLAQAGAQGKKKVPPGPGMHLKFIFQELGFEACGLCGEWVCKMEHWGAQGCRQHAAEIIARLREAAAELKWHDKFKLLGRTMTTGWVVKINWLNPLPDLLNEAIKRAERELERANA